MLIVVLTYFDPKIGPKVFQCIPEKTLDRNLAKRVERFMDLDFGESSFEINISDRNFKSFNHLINLPSKNSRGYVESFLLSIIVDREYESTKIFEFLKDVNNKFLDTVKIVDDVSTSQDEIKNILEDTRKTLIETLEEFYPESCDVEEKQEVGSVEFLSLNLKKLTQNIAGKNQFQLTKFKLLEKSEGRYSIKINLKGGGFLTRPLKKVTIKSVYDGVENYMISNGITKENFEIQIK